MPDPGMSGSARCQLRDWKSDTRLRVFGDYLGRYERLGAAREGELVLGTDGLGFIPDTGTGFEIPLLDITAVQPSSRTLQIKARNRPVFSVRFDASSPKLWEERLQAALRHAYAKAGRHEIAEFQPRVTVRPRRRTSAGSRLRRQFEAGASLAPKPTWQFRLAAWLARTAWRYMGGGVAVDGLENIPEKGPFLVISNHESYLETMLLPAVVPRATYSMAKSTQFGVPVYGWLMARLAAFPVRRFETDPQTLRFVARRMAAGYGIVIYIEGERTWDGALQAARLGVARLALLAGVPVIPCRVSGAFHAWPRWASGPQRGRIRLSFGPALPLPVAVSRADAERLLDDAVQLIRNSIDPES